jgi:iron complex transport system substrate-binding protein
VDHQEVSTKVEYAKGFKIGAWGGFQTLTIVKSFQDAKAPDKYVLVPKDAELAEIPEGFKVIRVPADRIIATSTTHLAAFELINAADAIIGFPATKYIYSEQYLQQIEKGLLVDLGSDMNLDFEAIIDLEPDLFMGYTLNGDLGQYQILDRADIPLFLNAGYLETSPLGRAEWVKVAGMLTGRMEKADSVFDQITSNYFDQLELARSLDPKPTVLSGIMYQGTWYMPGGKSWAARYFEDAGAKYLWQEDQTRGSIPLSLESVFETGIDADYWVGTSDANSLNQLLELDQRYGEFKAFKDGNVYNYSKRVNKNGGNDYFEMAIMRPDLVVKDLVSIFSSNGKEVELLYFQKLRNDL